MAAVAGSKGRIAKRETGARGPQLAVVAGLLEGRLDAEGAAHVLLDNAALREVGVDTNMICNLSCSYCYLSDRKLEAGSVPVDFLATWLARLAHGGTKLIAFIGKEPLADDRAIQLLERLDAMRLDGQQCFRTGMVTNGTLVRRWLRRLEESGISYLDISVDGLSDRENRLRGPSLSRRILEGVDAIVGSSLRSRFATATVLTSASCANYPAFVEQMFGRGVPTCFASPVLRFAMSNEVSASAVSLDELLALAERLRGITGPHGDEQVIIDLPYKYSWALLSSRFVPIADVEEDAHEALFWRMPGSMVHIKLNPFPFSYWRALRVTHDGNVILNMDLAAHPEYSRVSTPLGQVDRHVFVRERPSGFAILTDAIARLIVANPGSLHERDLAGQHWRDLALRSAA